MDQKTKLRLQGLFINALREVKEEIEVKRRKWVIAGSILAFVLIVCSYFLLTSDGGFSCPSSYTTKGDYAIGRAKWLSELQKTGNLPQSQEEMKELLDREWKKHLCREVPDIY